MMLSTKQSLKKLLMSIAERPGMYVSKCRFDYIDCFQQGLGMGFSYACHALKQNAPTMYPWNSHYDIQKWLLLKESVSIVRSTVINGWMLFQRCYGIKQSAFEQFQKMLEEIEFSSHDEYSIHDDGVDAHIFQVYCLYKYGRNLSDEEIREYHKFNTTVSAKYYPVNDDIKSIIGEIGNDYASIIPIVNRLINEPYDDLLIYLHYETCFLCVKFLYRTGQNDWVESSALRHQDDSYDNLVILHAYAAIIQKEEHKNHIITLRKTKDDVYTSCAETKDIWAEIRDDNVDISALDKNSFIESYSNWLKGVISPESELTSFAK